MSSLKRRVDLKAIPSVGDIIIGSNDESEMEYIPLYTFSVYECKRVVYSSCTICRAQIQLLQIKMTHIL